MFFSGGTNFGFLNGANSDTRGTDNAGLHTLITSYDYDSPITEYGGYTTKYNISTQLITARNTIITVKPDRPKEEPLVAYSELEPTGQLLLSSILDTQDMLSIPDIIPMEMLPINNNSGQSFGYILYRQSNIDIPTNATLKISGYVRDTVLVLLNGKLISNPPSIKADLTGFGFWKKKNSQLILTQEELKNATLDLLVENFGRNNFGTLDMFQQFKGLTEDVFINDIKLTSWQIAPLEFKKAWNKNLLQHEWSPIGKTVSTPALYRFILNIEGNPQDTYLDMRDWNKGITIVNGFVLGRHFFLGPQQSLYLPAPLLQSGSNDIVVFEHYNAPEILKFSNGPIWGGPSH